MDPRCGDHLVEEPPAESNGSVEAAILVERIERLGVRLEPPAEPGGLRLAQVLAQHLLIAGSVHQVRQSPNPIRHSLSSADDALEARKLGPNLLDHLHETEATEAAGGDEDLGLGQLHDLA